MRTYLIVSDDLLFPALIDALIKETVAWLMMEFEFGTKLIAPGCFAD